MKLAGSSWGAIANANILRSSALALCYSVAEYCCPVWQRYTHVSLVDAQLHSSMRLSLAPSNQLHYHGCPFSQIMSVPMTLSDLTQISRSQHFSMLNISETTHVFVIVTIERQYDVVYALSNGDISNNVEGPLTQFSRSQHF